MNTTENPNAFPIAESLTNIYHPGMSLLDYFAGQALADAAPLAYQDMSVRSACEMAGLPDGTALLELLPICLSRLSYNIGQAMLDERTKRLNA